MFALCPPDVGIILTYRCHSGCKHCLYKYVSWPNNASVLRSAVIMPQYEIVVHRFRTDARSSQHNYADKVDGAK